ncbi:ribosomal protein L7/L12 [Catellatospora methionotrophica]|uniref:ribosomal protein L7/L12 n=1 Tax=Catellatospora methionotrophica TaxID=121620 RepID=UPI0033F5E597
MTEILMAVIVLLLAVIVLLLVRRRRADPTDLLGSAMAARNTEHARSAHAAPAAGGDALVQQVRSLMAQRKKVPAVKLWREATGVSLAEAVRDVDLIAAGGLPSPPAAGLPPTAQRLAGPDLMANASALKHQGRAIEAIKLVRQHTGLGLREAKNIVDGL